LDSGKNATGQEAFGHKGVKASAEQSPAMSAADVSSQTPGAAGTTTLEDTKVVAGGAEQVEGLQEPQAGGESRPNQENEDNRCLYVGTLQEDDVVADFQDKMSSRWHSRRLRRYCR
jgi:hypothetical protein